MNARVIRTQLLWRESPAIALLPLRELRRPLSLRSEPETTHCLSNACALGCWMADCRVNANYRLPDSQETKGGDCRGSNEMRCYKSNGQTADSTNGVAFTVKSNHGVPRSEGAILIAEVVQARRSAGKGWKSHRRRTRCLEILIFKKNRRILLVQPDHSLDRGHAVLPRERQLLVGADAVLAAGLANVARGAGWYPAETPLRVVRADAVVASDLVELR
jgi:hypothetical protein